MVQAKHHQGIAPGQPALLEIRAQCFPLHCSMYGTVNMEVFKTLLLLIGCYSNSDRYPVDSFSLSVTLPPGASDDGSSLEKAELFSLNTLH